MLFFIQAQDSERKQLVKGKSVASADFFIGPERNISDKSKFSDSEQMPKQLFLFRDRDELILKKYPWENLWRQALALSQSCFLRCKANKLLFI